MIGYLLAFVFLVDVGSTFSNDTTAQIINGEPTTIKKHPHQISLQVLKKGIWYHNCGGSIVRRKWVVTAAHCVDGWRASRLNVVLNNGALSDPNRKHYTVDRIFKHPNYTGSGNYPNDIALLKLKSCVDLSGTSKVITLANPNENFDGQTCRISGWGHTVTGNSTKKKTPDQLQETNGVILNDNECKSEWPQYYNGSVHICIDNKRTGACQGDSGGPMVCLRDSTPVLAGVTSWVEIYCNVTYPSVYARVSSYSAWLKQTMGI